MTDILLRTEALAKTYEMGEIHVHALRGVDPEVARGKFIAIMGASGSGKTTFMNLLGCLDKASTGSYVLDGIAVHQMSDEELTLIRNQKIGYVFQNFYLLPVLPLWKMWNYRSCTARNAHCIHAVKKLYRLCAS